MAVGAWTMPMYNAQLAHDDAVQILTKVKEVKTDTGDLDKGLTGGKDLGKANLVSLLTADKDKSTLSKVLGDDFIDFQSSFLGAQSKADANTAGVKVRSFSAPIPVTLLPNNLAGETVDANNENTCGTGQAMSTSSTKPQQLLGFAISQDTAAPIVRVGICASDGPLSGDVLVDEIVSFDTNPVFTKNFDIGVIPPGSALKVFIDDGATNEADYKAWLMMGDPEQGFEISTFQGVGTPCNSITVEVHASGSAVGAGAAIVEVSHEFVPFFDSQSTDGSGQVVFNGPLPPGNFFIDVFPAGASGFPTFVDESCTGGSIIDLTPNGDGEVELGSASTLTADGSGTLTVNVIDETGVPFPNTNNFVDHTSLPVINDVCNDGTPSADSADASECDAIDADFVYSGDIGKLTEGTATYTLADLPIGSYFIESCTNNFQCGFIQASVTNGQTTTVTVEVLSGGSGPQPTGGGS